MHTATPTGSMSHLRCVTATHCGPSRSTAQQVAATDRDRSTGGACLALTFLGSLRLSCRLLRYSATSHLLGSFKLPTRQLTCVRQVQGSRIPLSPLLRRAGAVASHGFLHHYPRIFAVHHESLPSPTPTPTPAPWELPLLFAFPWSPATCLCYHVRTPLGLPNPLFQHGTLKTECRTRSYELRRVTPS